MQRNNGRTLVKELGSDDWLAKLKREAGYWIQRPDLNGIPVRWQDLRPLPKLAVLGLAVTAPYYIVPMSWMGVGALVDWYERGHIHRCYGASEEFRLHEGILASSNPLRWAGELDPATTTGVVVGSLALHAAALRRFGARAIQVQFGLLALCLVQSAGSKLYMC